jgi:hypothetical protein
MKNVGQASCLTRQTGILLSRRSLAKAEPVIQRPKSFHAINNTKILAIGGNNSPSISRRESEKQSCLTEKIHHPLLPPRLCASARNNSSPGSAETRGRKARAPKKPPFPLTNPKYFSLWSRKIAFSSSNPLQTRE